MDYAGFLKEAGARVEPVRVVMPGGRQFEVPLGELSYHEFVECGLAVPEPAVPYTKMESGEKRQNPNDVEYKKSVSRANDERNFRRLLLAMQKGGIVVPGADVSEQIAHLRNDAVVGVSLALIQHVTASAMASRAQVVALKDSF